MLFQNPVRRRHTEIYLPVLGRVILALFYALVCRWMMLSGTMEPCVELFHLSFYTRNEH